jgi:hypothetical protein
MVRDEVKERLLTDKRTGSQNRVAISPWIGLFEKRQSGCVRPCGVNVGILLARANHDRNIVNSGTDDFIQSQSEGRANLSAPIHDALQRKTRVKISCSRDDSFTNFHGTLSSVYNRPSH